MAVRALKTFHMQNPETGERVKILRGEELPEWASFITNPKIVGTGSGRSADAEPEPPAVETEQEDGDAQVETGEGENSEPLDDLKVGELRKLAKDHDVDLTGAKVKADIVAALTDAGVTG